MAHDRRTVRLPNNAIVAKVLESTLELLDSSLASSLGSLEASVARLSNCFQIGAIGIAARKLTSRWRNESLGTLLDDALRLLRPIIGLRPFRGSLRSSIRTSLLAILTSLLAIGRIGSCGERWRCNCACQEKRNEKLTHDSDLSSSLQRLLLFLR
jgi:hypothetical protein